MPTLMIQKAKEMMGNAYAPYSRFRVGSSLTTTKGTLFGGANVENFILPSSQCAEASAIGAMVAAGETQIAELVIMGSGAAFCAPCGNCRQMIREFSSADTQIHICNSNGDVLKTVTIADLLPLSFGSQPIEPGA